MNGQPPIKGEKRQFGQDVGQWDGQQWVAVDGSEQPPSGGGIINGLADTLWQGVVGAMKGAGQTATNLGQMVDKIPGVGTITRGLGDAMGDAASRMLYGDTGPRGASKPGAAFEQANRDLEPSNKAQNVGKTLEQVGEFALPGPAVGRGITEGLVHAIPDAMSPGAMRVMNKIAALAGRVTGDAAGVAGVGMLHGDENVDAEAGIAGGTTLTGEALAEALPHILNNPVLAKVLPVFLASAFGGAIGGAGGVGLGAGLGMFGVKRSLAKEGMDYLASHPREVASGTRAATRFAGRIGAGAKSESEARPKRRPLAEVQP